MLIDWSFTLHLEVMLLGDAFGGAWMCNIRRSFYDEQVKLWVMHLFWWSKNLFWLDCFDGFSRILFPILCVRDECLNICTTCWLKALYLHWAIALKR